MNRILLLRMIKVISCQQKFISAPDELRRRFVAVDALVRAFCVDAAQEYVDGATEVRIVGVAG